MMDPALVFFAIRGVIRVGAAAREAYEQSVRDSSFVMPPLPYVTKTVDMRLIEYFNTDDGVLKTLTKDNGKLSQYWIDDAATGGRFKTDPESLNALMAAMAEHKRLRALNDGDASKRGWIQLRTLDEEALTGVLDQWSKDARPVGPWGRIALALADVALDYVGSNPSILGVGGNGEALIKVVCDALQQCLAKDALDGPESQFVERMGVSLLQAGLKVLVEKPNLIVTDKAAASVISSVATPVSKLFADAVEKKNYTEQLRWTNIRDNVLPQMVSAGLSALADHQQEVLGAQFDPNNTLGYFTKGFLISLSDTPVTTLGTAQAWMPIYQSLLRAAAAKPNLIIKGGDNDANAEAVRSLIGSVAKSLADHTWPYTKDTAINLGLVVIDELGKQLPARTRDPWILLVPAVLQSITKGLRNSNSIASLPQDALTEVIRVILRQAAVTPGMITGNSASVELQAIITAVATAMAEDTKALVSEEGWIKIASIATAAAARNPGKLFKINDATPEGQLAAKLLSKLLANASASFGAARSSNAVLFGDTLVDAIEDTLTAAAGNAKGALENTDQMLVLVDRLNKLVANPDKPIGAADWTWLYRNLISDVFDKGAVNYTDEQLRKMLYDHKLPGA